MMDAQPAPLPVLLSPAFLDRLDITRIDFDGGWHGGPYAHDPLMDCKISKIDGRIIQAQMLLSDIALIMGVLLRNNRPMALITTGRPADDC